MNRGWTKMKDVVTSDIGNSIVTLVLILGLLVLSKLPDFRRHSQISRHLAKIVTTLRDDEMHREDVEALVGGYYEGLEPDAGLAGMPHEREDVQFRSDFLRYELRPNLSRPYQAGMRITNSFGMANPEYPYAKPPHTRRIAVLGDSQSLGPYGHDYVAILENRLNQDCRTPEIQSYQVLNFAVYGYSVVQLMDVARDKAPLFHPDVYLVVMTNLEVIPSTGWRAHVGRLIASGTDLKYGYLRQVVVEAGIQPTNHLPTIRKKLKPYVLPVTQWALEQIRDRAAAQGAQTVIVMLPSPINPEFISSDFNFLRTAVDAVGVPVVDLRDTYRTVNLDQVQLDPVKDIHPNALGHALLADSLITKLQAQPGAWLAVTGRPCEMALAPLAMENNETHSAEIHRH